MSIIIKSVQEMEGCKQQLNKIKVFVCATACGKSVLCQQDDRFFDLDKWGAELLHRGVPDFAERTLPKAEEMLKQGKIVINAFHSGFLKYLDENNIPFCTVFAAPDQVQEYVDRMRKRGSDENFIQKFGNTTVEKFAERMQDPRPEFKIILNSGEYVSTYLLKIFDKTFNKEVNDEAQRT